MIGGAFPRRCARQVEQHRHVFAPDRRKRVGGPEISPCCGVGQGVLGKPADISALERMGGEFAAGGPAVEHERDERNPGEAPALPIEHSDRPHDVAVDSGLLLHFLHHNLSW